MAISGLICFACSMHLKLHSLLLLFSGAYRPFFLRQHTMPKHNVSFADAQDDAWVKETKGRTDKGASGKGKVPGSLSRGASSSALEPVLEDPWSIDPGNGLPRWVVMEGRKALILYRPCVDCGLKTGSICENMCLAKWWLPRERWEDDQNTPHCTHCEKKFGKCHYCRQCAWCSPPSHGPAFEDCGLDGDGCRARPKDMY